MFGTTDRENNYYLLDNVLIDSTNILLNSLKNLLIENMKDCLKMIDISKNMFQQAKIRKHIINNILLAK